MNTTTLTPATTAKADAIRASMHPTCSPSGLTPPVLLAMLTSANKDEREAAKREVRALVAAGNQILAAEHAEQDLANFANRNEP